MLPSPKSTFTASFHCTTCGHEFRKNLRRIYVHWPTFEQRVLNKKDTGRSEYVIPQRIVCPKCGALDHYEFAPYTRNMLAMTMTVAMMAGLVEGHPVQIIHFALSDGTVMHPLDTLEWYQARVEKAPADLKLRMRYANTLRTLGYFDEAEAEYTHILERDVAHTEAWYNLAAIHVARKHKGAARKALAELVAHAEQSPRSETAGWVNNARHYLAGDWPLDELTPDGVFLAAPLQMKSSRRRRK